MLELVKRAKTGDTAAVRELIARTERSVRFVVYGMMGAGYQADDIAHDAITHAILNIEKCHASHDGQVAAWFIVVAENHVKSYLRSPEHARAELTDATAEWLQSPPITYLLPPEERFEQLVLLGLLREAFEALPQQTRDIIVARIYNDRPWKEVADRVGLSVEAAKQRTNRAIQRLGRQITERAVNYTTIGPRFKKHLVRMGVIKDERSD
ncbi:sigma-70 family RNA polymerase sigma factor [Longimicrobium sp.]|uniref:RNA polymerase sigma factor n=1 Tax=Longimicrobium sp. TaxID=2029185 RepID=UPI002BDAFBA9|nr:sigma-70 family RNA polymerase sigma factor [Longimicrobium sp.]HSU13499.1 sigma-70 family RNA polymerase sigma factor [Longimicrobium sp.]